MLAEHLEPRGDLLLFELHRFDESGQRRVRFAQGKCVFLSGESFHVIHRTATYAGMERFLLTHTAEFRDRTIHIFGAQFAQDPELGASARARSAWIKERLQAIRDGLNCLHCGAPVSTSGSAIVEVDDEDYEPDAGVVHERCIQPLHRILGQIHSTFLADNRHIVDFDVKLWVESLRKGQGMLAGLRETGSPRNAVVAWSAEPIDTTLRYCVRVLLASGGRPPVMRRGRVHRCSLETAKTRAAQLSAAIDRAAREGNPLCMSDDGLTFGQRSVLTDRLQAGAISECLQVDVEPYSRALGDQYDRRAEYYAPLIAIRVGESESYLEFEGSCVLLSDILSVEKHFLNWAAAGILIPDYYLEIVADDVAFHVLMQRNVDAGRTAVIDPLLSPDGHLVSGVPIVPLSSVVENHGHRIHLVE